MTIVFDDEDLYTKLKVEAARTHRPAKDLVAEALHLLFGAPPDDVAMMRGQRGIGASADGSGVQAILEQLVLTKEVPVTPVRQRTAAPP